MRTELGWKVPFREYYSTTFLGMLAGCWTCLAATVSHRLRGSPGTPGGPKRA